MAGRRNDLRARELGAFLRSRRTRLAPEAVGLPGGEGVRRTPGLRRAEVARLAGVSAGYYTRLEQGRAPHPSAGVLGALARALRLTPQESGHLFALAADPAGPLPEAAVPASGARRMLDLLAPPTAGYVIDARSDVLAWNSTAAALFAHLVEGPRRPNNVRYVFTDPAARTLFADWPEIAADSVAHLRAATGHRPDDPALAALVAELTTASPDFRRLWTARALHHKVDGRKRLLHPAAGPLTLDYVVLSTPLPPPHRLVAYSATAGTQAFAALTRLGQDREGRGMRTGDCAPSGATSAPCRCDEGDQHRRRPDLQGVPDPVDPVGVGDVESRGQAVAQQAADHAEEDRQPQGNGLAPGQNELGQQADDQARNNRPEERHVTASLSRPRLSGT